MKPFHALNDTDLHLYLAGALPPGKRLLMAWALLLDAGLRSRLEALRGENGSRAEALAALRSRLFPAAAAGAARTRPSPAGRPPAGFRSPPARRRGFALAGAFAALALCAVPWLFRAPGAGEDPEVIAKGRGLGVTLYVKGDSAYRVENHAARLSPTDTLQAVPLGTSPQHLVLLGWDESQGLVRLFPTEGARSRQVSPAEPPPALLLQGMEENRLVCITATSAFRVEDAEALLRGKPFQPLREAPSVRLEKGLYVQVFAITKTLGRLI